jgi:hypothetical protein
MIAKWAKMSSRVGWGRFQAQKFLKKRSSKVNPIWVGGIGAGQSLLPRGSIEGREP